MRCLTRSAHPRGNIARLHFAYDAMQQAGSDHFVPAKLRRNIFKESIALGDRYWLGGLHQPLEIVDGQSQAHLIERGHGKAPRSLKPRECRHLDFVRPQEKFRPETNTQSELATRLVGDGPPATYGGFLYCGSIEASQELRQIQEVASSG
jgi:hypothetical protein